MINYPLLSWKEGIESWPRELVLHHVTKRGDSPGRGGGTRSWSSLRLHGAYSITDTSIQKQIDTKKSFLNRSVGYSDAPAPDLDITLDQGYQGHVYTSSGFCSSFSSFQSTPSNLNVLPESNLDLYLLMIVQIIRCVHGILVLLACVMAGRSPQARIRKLSKRQKIETSTCNYTVMLKWPHHVQKHICSVSMKTTVLLCNVNTYIWYSLCVGCKQFFA